VQGDVVSQGSSISPKQRLIYLVPVRRPVELRLCGLVWSECCQSAADGGGVVPDVQRLYPMRLDQCHHVRNMGKDTALGRRMGVLVV